MNFKNGLQGKLKKCREIFTLVGLAFAETVKGKGIEGELRKSLGNQYEETGEYEKAIDYQKEAYDIADEQGNSEKKQISCGRLVELYFKTKNYGMSIHYCNKYLKNASPGSRKEAHAEKILGLSHQNLGQDSEAVSHLERCLELYEGLSDDGTDAEIAKINGNLGISYIEIGEYEKAIEKLNKCLQISDKWGLQTLTQQVCVQLGYVYKALRQHKSATDYFQHSLRFAKRLQDNEKIAKAYNDLAEAYLSQRKPQDAIDCLKEAYKIGDRLKTAATHAVRLGCAYLMKKEPDDAIKYFEEYLLVADDDADGSEKANVFVKMGKSYAESKKYQLAFEYYWKGLEIIKELEEKKTESEAHEGLGDAYYKTKEYNDAKTHYKKALEIANTEDDEEMKGRLYNKMGNVFLVQENTEEAFVYYMEALTIAESLGDNEMEADAHEGLGNSTTDPEKAIDSHRKSVELATSFGDMKRQQQAHESLGNAYLACKKLSEANENYKSCCAIARDCKDIEAVYRCRRNMGNAYFENGDYDNAIFHHEICLETATQMNFIQGKAESCRVMGCSYSKINQPEKALTYYDKFLGMADAKIDDKVATVCLEAGKLYVESDNLKRAIPLYQQCLNLVKDNLELKQEVLEKLGDAYYKNFQYNDAYKYYSAVDQPSIQPDRQCQINYKLGKVEISRKNTQTAIQYYYTALDLPRDEKIHADISEALGEASHLNKDYENAITYHTQSLEFANRISNKKQQQRCNESLGDAYSARGEWLLAVDYYLSCYSNVGDDKDRIVQCERKLGKAYYQVRNFKKAIEFLENANEKSQLKENYEIIGSAYVKIGQYKEAMQFFCMQQSTTDQNDKLGQAKVQGNIGWLRVKTGEYQHAIECHQKALELIQQSEENNTEAAEADAYCNLGCAYQAKGENTKALEKQMEFLKLAENLKDKSRQGRALKKIGNIHCATGNHDEAIGFYYDCLDVVGDTEKSTKMRVKGKLGCIGRTIGWHEMAIGCHEEQANMADNPEDRARALANLGTDYELQGDYIQALKYQEDYLNVAKEMGNDTEQGHAYVNIGKIHLAKGEYKKAIEMSETAEKLGNKAVKARAYSVIGCAYRELGQYMTAKDTHRKEMDMLKFDDNLGKAQAYGNMGMAHVGTGDYNEAIACFREQMTLVEKTEDKGEKCRVNINFGNYHAAIGECNEAVSFYQKSLQIAKEIDDKTEIGRAKGCMGVTFTEMGQYQNAVECHEDEIKIAKGLRNDVRRSQALGNLGNAYVGLCNYKEGIELLEESLNIAKENNVQNDEKRAKRNLGDAYVATGQYRKALTFLGSALKISQQLGQKAAEGRIQESMARALYLSGQIEQSIESSEKSLSIAHDVGDRAGEGRARRTLGNAYIEFGQNYRKAISHFRGYLRISEELSNEAGKGDALESMATVFIEIGQFNKALKCCDEALEIAENLKDKKREGRAYENLGKLYMAVGQYKEAIENHRRHLKIATELSESGDEAEIGRANGNLGNAYNADKNHEKAMKCHTIQKDIADKLDNDAEKARAQGNMGNTYTYKGRFERALKCHFERLDIAEKRDDKPSLAKALLGLGKHYIKTKQFGEAIEYLHRLEKLSRPTDLDSSELTAMAQELLGRCYLENEVPKACSYFAKSIINYQIVRDPLIDHDELNISMSNRFAHVHKLLFRSLLNMKNVKTALLVSDCGKAQALYDLMWKMVQSHQSFSFKNCDPMEEVAKGLSSVASEKLFNNSLNDVIKSKQADTIISYAFGEDDDLHSWVISQEGVFHEELKITNETSMRKYLWRQIKDLNKQLNVTSAQVDTSQDVRDTVHDFEARTCNPHWLMSDDIESDEKRLANTCSPLDDHNTISRKPGPSTTALTKQTALNIRLRHLYATLIQPIEERLIGSKLLIVPEGPLFTLPFAALLDSDGKHLCDKYSLQFTSSLHVLNSCLSNRPEEELRRALFVGNPAISTVYLRKQLVHLNPLEFAEREVDECSYYFNAQRLVKDMATKANVLNEMKSASIIHIAAHGDMNRAEIFLTPDERDPHETSSYLLTPEDILNKTSLKARLVVLSCCHSGSGEISAEGVVGVARSFIGSGARAVLVALWAINDERTMEFMVELYKKLIEGCPVCTALQQTMISLKRKYWEPTSWAQFQLFGEDIVFTKEEIEEIRLKSASR